MPEKMLTVPTAHSPTITIRVGYFGTFPVFINSITIGIKNPMPMIIVISPIAPKNTAGLSSRRSLNIVLKTLYPSE